MKPREYYAPQFRGVVTRDGELGLGRGLDDWAASLTGMCGDPYDNGEDAVR